MFLAKYVEGWKSLKAAIPETRAILKDVNRLMWRVDRWTVRMTWVGAIIRGVTTLGLFGATGLVLQRFTADYTTGSLSAAMVAVAIAVMIAWIISIMLTSALREFRSEVFKERIRALLTRRMARIVRKLDIGRLNDPAFIALLESAHHRGKSSVTALFGVQQSLVSALVGLAASLGVIIVLQDPVLLLLAIIPVVSGTVRSVLWARRDREMWEHNHDLRRKKDEYHQYVSKTRMLEQSKLLHWTGFMWRRYRSHLRALLENNRHIAHYRFRLAIGMTAVTGIATTISFGYIGHSLIAGDLSIATAVLFFGSVQTLQTSLSGVSEALVDVRTESRDYAYLQQLAATRPLNDERDARPIRLESTPTLEVRDVTFTYPSQSRPALRNCSFMIEPGERVAIVGRNGSGKTTVARLLTKVYLPSFGDVLVNGSPTKGITQDSLLEYMLLVTQDSTVPDLPIDEALAGNSRELLDYHRLVRASSLSGAREFIDPLPNGYQTQIGEEWPGGVGFSSGQMQRLKLASAFYRLLDPQVYVALFDEPMSHCDAETRQRFYQGLSLMVGKTIIVIAHDPLYLHHFERVLVMEAGTLVQDLRGRQTIEGYRNTLTEALAADLLEA